MLSGAPVSHALVWGVHLAILWAGPRRLGHRLRTSVGVGVASAAITVALWRAEQDLRSMLFAASLGIAATWSHHTHAMTYRTLELLEDERAELRTALDRIALVEERARIARELHDGLGARLTALYWRVQRLTRSGAGALGPRVAEIAARTSHALGELRATAWVLRAATRPASEVLDFVRARIADAHPQLAVEGAVSADAIEVELSSELGLAAVRDVEATLRGAPPGKSPERVELTVHARGVDASVVWRGE
ncbi:MAG: hypothetical protein KC657_39765 [Myxococcales bacterium]|nr:hypothetical protein [Myxococcales bacterium]